MDMDCGVDRVDAVLRRGTMHALPCELNAESVDFGAGVRMSAQCSQRLLGKYMQSQSGLQSAWAYSTGCRARQTGLEHWDVYLSVLQWVFQPCLTQKNKHDISSGPKRSVSGRIEVEEGDEKEG